MMKIFNDKANMVGISFSDKTATFKKSQEVLLKLLSNKFLHQAF